MKASTFQFSNPVIDRLELKKNDTFCQENHKIKMNNSFSVDIRNLSYDDMNATVCLKTEIGGLTSDQPFYLQIEVSAKFNSSQKISEEEFDKLLHVNAPALLLSYSRPMVSLITSQSGLSSLNLPFINFTVD